MKRTPKKVFGTLGLLIVAATTIFAASLPTPSASAADNSTVDTIVVRVLSNTPMVNITKPSGNTETAHADQNISYSHEYVSKVTAVLEYTDEDGNPHRDLVFEQNVEEQYGDGIFNLNMSGYPYGDYVLKLIGSGIDGVEYEDAITLSYYPVTTTLDSNEETNDTFVNLDYDLDDLDIDTLVIELYDENGNLMQPITPITVKRGTTIVELPLVEYGIPEGKYYIRTTAYDGEGVALYKPYEMIMNYTIKRGPDVPNTGAMTFGQMNISKGDYLATGLIILVTAGLSGIYFVSRRKNTSRKRR